MLNSTRKLLILAALVVGLGLSAAPQAEAGWWHRHCGYRYHGYYGYYGWGHYGWGCGWSSCYTPVYRPVYVYRAYSPCYSYYSCARPVIRSCYVPYRVYDCCSTCCCDPCCCYGSVSSAVSVVDSPSDVQATQKPTLAPPATPEPAPAPAAGTPNDPAPAPAKTFALPPDPAEPASAPTPAPTPAPAPAPSLKLDTDPAPAIDPLLPDPSVPQKSLDPLQGKGVSVPTNEGTISIIVPENARVTINGYVTKSSGRIRRYVAKSLQPGLVYPFNIQVEVVRDGQTLTDQRQVKLSGGSLEAVVFNFDKTTVDRIAKAY